MKNKLNSKQLILIASMLFGMFFGAGNLIFPVHMGQLAGKNVWLASLGFIITGVGLPLLGVAAIGISKSKGLFDLASKVGKKYAVFFTTALYLTIGPFFAIPRTAGTSFTVGIAPITKDSKLALLIFSFLFFAIVLFFALKPNKILTWIGKILNPIFLVLLFIMIATCFIKPMGSVGTSMVASTYKDTAFFNGFLEGYNTMDALASLAFGIIIVEVIKRQGILEPNDVARNTVKAGVFSCAFMGLIYLLTALMGAKSTGLLKPSENGGIALYKIATHYFGEIGAIILAVMITVACLKTAIALVQSCSETFTDMFKSGPKYKVWVIIFTLFSFAMANVGLTSIINYAVPVLMFLYPLAIVLIVLALFGKYFKYDRKVFVSAISFTLVGSIVEFIHSLKGVNATLYKYTGGKVIDSVAVKVLPFYKINLGWVVLALIGIVVGIIIYVSSPRKKL